MPEKKITLKPNMLKALQVASQFYPGEGIPRPMYRTNATSHALRHIAHGSGDKLVALGYLKRWNSEYYVITEQGIQYLKELEK